MAGTERLTLVRRGQDWFIAPVSTPEILPPDDPAAIAEVAAEKPQGKPDDAALERIRSRVMGAYPGLRFDVFLRIGLPAEWERQARAAGAAQ